jgi:hypothetical protein
MVIDPVEMKLLKRIEFGEVKKMELDQVYESSEKTAAYDHANNVLNGIAFDPEEEVFYLSGKQWHDIYKVRLHSEEEIYDNLGPDRNHLKFMEKNGISMEDLEKFMNREIDDIEAN